MQRKAVVMCIATEMPGMGIHIADSARGTVRPLIAMGLVITALMVLGWGTFFVIVLPGQYLMGGQTVFGTGLALTAFTLGLRHGFDPAHIAAIDNTTPKLAADDYRPVPARKSVGLGKRVC